MATATRPKDDKRSNPPSEILTLPEAAAYLRIPEDAVLEAVKKQHLPGRLVRSEWRFLKSAIQEWLRVGPESDFWSTHVGALRDDPYLQPMLEQIYAERGRSMTG